MEKVILGWKNLRYKAWRIVKKILKVPDYEIAPWYALVFAWLLFPIQSLIKLKSLDGYNFEMDAFVVDGIYFSRYALKSLLRMEGCTITIKSIDRATGVLQIQLHGKLKLGEK
jgi:hypothetical protein